MKNDRYQKIARHCWISFTLLTFFAFLPSACKKNEALPEDVQNLGRATGPVSPKPVMPGAAGQAPAAAKVHQGTVQESIAVSRYTYVRIEDKSGAEIWAAVPQAKIAVGSEVRVVESILMRDFKSPGLDKTFPSIVFGVLAETETGGRDAGAAPAKGPAEGPAKLPPLPPGHPPIGSER